MVCLELGFSSVDNKATTHSHFGPAETPLLISHRQTVPISSKKIACNGDESSLVECTIAEATECGYGEAAGVICNVGDQEKKRKKRAAVTAAAVLSGLSDGAAGAESVSKIAGSAADTAESLVKVKKSLTEFFDRGPVADSGGKAMLASALEYFKKKQQEREDALKDVTDKKFSSVDLGPAGIEVKLKNDKGYMDLGGEFQQGGMDLKIQEISSGAQSARSGGDAFMYPAGIGPMLVNGCFGKDYKVGDPCYAAKRLSTKCLNMMEAAAYIGVGFDGTGSYTHASRRKSLVQRMCANKGSYQGEDVPDTMNVFGIYDTGCTSKTFDSMEARSAYQRQESKAGNNKNFLSKDSETGSLSTSSNVAINSWLYDMSGSYSNRNQYSKESQRSESASTVQGRASEGLSKSKTVTRIFEFTCRIRRYEMFMDEVTPSQLSEAFLMDYINLPVRFNDFRAKAPQKYIRFLERWGTHSGSI